MGKAIVLRADHGADDLRRLARASRDATQTRRLLALAIHDGASRTEAAGVGGVGLQIVRDWVMRFNAHGPLGPQAARPAVASEAGAARCAREGRRGRPKPELHGVVRWRLGDLVGWLQDTFEISLSRQTLGRELRRMGFRKLSACPRDHAQNPEALEAFKKPSRRAGGDPRQAAPGDRHRALVAGVRHGSRSTYTSTVRGPWRTRAQVRRTGSRAGGRGAGPGPVRRTTSAPCGPAFSARSARRRARPPAL